MKKPDISAISTYETGVVQSTAHRILSRLKADYLAQYGLTSTQWFVIGYAYDAGEHGVTLSQLKELLDTSMPFITTTVNLLESKGILQKTSHTSDSRVKIARINPAYTKTVETIEKGLREELRNNLYGASDISREELETYIAVLYKIVRARK